MVEVTISGIPVKFPFEPYELQKDYMQKVIECLQNETNGILESPTGTGKTLSLLCSTLAWLELKKAQAQAAFQANGEQAEQKLFLEQLNKLGNGVASKSGFMVPQIIYSSRTHSQLAQAMQEMKRTSYKYLKASVIGSREQMCIHPEVVQEESIFMKNNMCQIKVKSRSCHFYNRVERQKENPAVTQAAVLDIEDLLKLGQTHKFCPYFMSKELKQDADIIFMPYNYLLDPRARKALGVELSNNIIILDEAHNVEKMCEESASLQIKSTDIALCTEEITEVMKIISDEHNDFSYRDSPPDFTPDDLCILKQMLLDFEKILDDVPIRIPSEGATFDGNYIFDMLLKAKVDFQNHFQISGIIEKIVLFLTTINQGPFAKKGNGLQLFADMLNIVFASNKPEFKEKIQKCYKVHIVIEDPDRFKTNTWLAKPKTKTTCRVLNYWCFSPGFGMNMLMESGIRSVILTSGTLAPLKPLITELEMNIGVQLENPHIVKGDQVCVKILTKGPDGEVLNCNFQNRDNPVYIKSLGMTISNLAKFIPDGLLIFFPSYPLLKKYKEFWQDQGIWSNINTQKPIFVEPRDKKSFQEAMTSYYEAVNNPNGKGAIFMGVCRGKVSEGLDFADVNGRAVIIIGLPYPPLKDPRIVLKKRYLDTCRVKNKEYLGGDDWYSLEATKAVNQAIGRVIRHRNDYGAIILLDSRFNNPRIINQMSLWLRKHIKTVSKYGEIIRELKTFFNGASEKFPVSKYKSSLNNSAPPPAQFETLSTYNKPQGLFDFSTSASTSALNLTSDSSPGLVTIHKRNAESGDKVSKRKKIKLMPNKPESEEEKVKEGIITSSNIKDYLALVKTCLNPEEFKTFLTSLRAYRDGHNLENFIQSLTSIFVLKLNLSYILLGLQPYILQGHKAEFQMFVDRLR